jgi:hypothetical protein
MEQNHDGKGDEDEAKQAGGDVGGNFHTSSMIAPP